MRARLLAAALVVGACAGVSATRGTRLPAALDRMTLLEEHPSMSPVVFDHARHVDPAAMGHDVACVDCHHTLREHPREVPAACISCHRPTHESPPRDESLPHDHSVPPDL